MNFGEFALKNFSIRKKMETLETYCLHCIATNFDAFYRLYKTSTSTNIQTCFMLLYKQYTGVIMKMCGQNRLTTEHLTFLLNKYSTEVNLTNVSCDLRSVGNRLLSMGNNVTVFDMTHVGGYLCEDFLRYLPNLQIFRAGYTRCSDKALSILAGNCRELKELCIDNCRRITDKGLQCLSDSIPPLEKLNVEVTSISSKGVAYALCKIPTLVEVRCENLAYALFEATYTESNTNQVFNLGNMIVIGNPMRPENYLTSTLNMCVKYCPHLQKIVVTEVMTEKQLQLISSFEELEAATIGGCFFVNPRLSINGFLEVRGEKLTMLRLTMFSLSIELLAKHCPNLISLTLERPVCEDEAYVPLNFAHLKHLNLHSASVDIEKNQLAYIVSSSPNLQELHMTGCDFSDNAKDIILDCPAKLTLLNFSETIVTIDFIEEIVKKHATLEALVLNNSGIDPMNYDDLLDLVDELERKVAISMVDYFEAIKQLYTYEDPNYGHVRSSYVLKL